MAVFVTSLIVFIASVITFLILLSMWVNTDAKSRENTNHQLWSVIVFFCCPIGLLFYIIIRGPQKQDYVYNKFTYRLLAAIFIFFLALFFLYIGTFYLDIASQEEGHFRRNGQFFRFESEVSETNWNITSTRSNGRVGRNFYLTQNELDNLYTFLRVNEGEVLLRLQQIHGDASESFVISDQTITTIDVTQIEPGMIRKYVIFREATDINLSISWSENNHRE